MITTDEDLLSAEEYLEEHGYLAPTDIGLTRGTYTITPTGLRWIEGVPPGATETSQETREGSEGAKPRRSPASEEDREGPEPGTGGARGVWRPWWRRVLGG